MVAARCLFVLLLAVPSAASAAPALSLEAKALLASGVAAGGKVIFFGVGRESRIYSSRIVVREEELEDTDADGTVRLELEEPIPFRSIWAAVDLASGDLAIAAPTGFEPTEIDFPVQGLLRGDSGNAGGQGGKPDRLEDRRYWIEALVVRPGQGAWRISAGDGDPDDEDGATNGLLRWAVAKGKPVKAGPPAPQAFEPKDTIVVIDPTRMEFYAGRLTGPPQ